MTTRGGGVAQEDNRYSLWDDVHRRITQKKRKKKQTNKLVHSTLGCLKKRKKKNTKNTKPKKVNNKKIITQKKMRRLSRSHPISLPHSGELFVIGCSRRK